MGCGKQKSESVSQSVIVPSPPLYIPPREHLPTIPRKRQAIESFNCEIRSSQVTTVFNDVLASGTEVAAVLLLLRRLLLVDVVAQEER